MIKAPRSWLLPALVTVVALLGCGGNPEPSEPGEPDQVTYVTNFQFFGRDAYAHCGVEEGFFADRNIEVTVERGNGTLDNLGYLLSDRAQFATVDLVGALIALGQDKEANSGWKAIAAIHQVNLSSWMTLDPDLRSPLDLDGKTIGLPEGAVTELLFPTYLTLARADEVDVTVENVEGDQLGDALANGRVDAIGQFVVGRPLIEGAAEGRKVFVHLYDIPDLYGVGLVATDELMASDPDLVERFRDALLESLVWALDNPQECGEIQHAAIDGAGPGPEIAAEEIKSMDGYVRVGEAPVGVIDDRKIARMISTLEGAGTVPPGITPQDLVAFDFVPRGSDE